MEKLIYENYYYWKSTKVSYFRIWYSRYKWFQEVAQFLSSYGKYLENQGFKVVDCEVIQYGEKEWAIKRADISDEARGEVMPVLVDFAHGKPMFEIHTDHHDSQVGVEKETSTSFKSARSNVETISQSVSPKDLFTATDLSIISMVDSANYAINAITPKMVMNFIYKYSFRIYMWIH